MLKYSSPSALSLLAVAAFAICIAVPTAQNQTLSTASLSGSVSDPSGARVANADVSLSSAEKGIKRVFKTDSEGNFSFKLLPAATYTLTVEATGFKTFSQREITLEVGQSANHRVTLSIGSSQEIQVTAATPLLQAENANVSAEVSTRQVTELPLNLRNVLTLVWLNSSVNYSPQQQFVQAGGEQSTADQDVSFLNFGGGYFGTTAFVLDGTWDTGNGWGGVEYVPSPDNVQEFKVQQNSFTAQYGWSTGNVINVVTKSGTSDLHGVVYDFLRNGALDANNYFNNLNGLERPNIHRNQFGVAIGGPVYIPGVYKQRNKTFFFFNYEGHRQTDPASTAGTIPSLPFRSGDFSALLGAQVGTDALCRPVLAGQIYDPFTTRQVTATCGPDAGQTVYIRDPIAGNLLSNSTKGTDPVGQNLIGYYPPPLNAALQNNWAATAAARTNSDEYSIRIDHNFSEQTGVYGRFSDKHEFKEESPPFYGANDPGGPGQVNPNNRWNVILGLSQVFNPTFIISANFGVVRWVEGNNMQSKGFQPSTLGLPTFIDPYSYQFPVVNVSGGYEGLGPQQGAGQGAFPHNVGSASVDFTKVRGPHSLSFGYMAVGLDENGGRIPPTTFNFDTAFTSGPDPTNPTPGTGNGIAAMLLGTPTSGSTGITFSEITRVWYHGLYLQDDWKANRKLTLNLGLRWDVQRPIRERYNRQAYFDYSTVNPVSADVGHNYLGQLVFNSSSDRGLYDTNYKNFASRIGFAYQVLPKLVMRGGYGIFYPSSFRGWGPAPGFTSDTPFIASTNGGLNPNETLSTAFSGGLVPVSGNSLAGLTNVGFSTSAVSRNRRATYVQQWMYGFQFAPTATDALDIMYVGNHGVGVILDTLNRNQINPQYFTMGNALLAQVANPFFGHITSSGCGLDQPTVAQGQLLRPYPEFCDIDEIQAPVGSSSYDSLQASYMHRVSRGLTVLASYTFSKFIDNVSGADVWATASNNGSTNVRNIYDLAAERSVDGTDIPHSFVCSYVYEIPVGRGRQFGSGMNSFWNAVAGGWQTSGIITLKRGFPLAIDATNGLNYFGAGQHPDITGDYHLAHPNRTQWFNPSAFTPAAPWTLGNAPRFFSDLRAPGYNDWDLSIQKYFPIQERIRLQFRVDMFNAFNHTNYYQPDTSYGPPPPSGGFSTISEAFSPKLVQAALKLSW